MPRLKCSDPNCVGKTPVSNDDFGNTVSCAVCGRTLKVPDIRGDQSLIKTGSGKSIEPKPYDSTSVADARAVSGKISLPVMSRFEVRSRLGSGGNGTVYLAYDQKLSREVALKLPQLGLLERPDVLERFLREARLAAKLRHPHIVPVFDAGEDQGNYYIATAFIDGQPLSRVIIHKRPDFKTSAEIVLKLALALHYAHGKGVIHRDVKPQNVLIDEQGEPHLLDFGLARMEQSSERLTQDGSVMGTPAYMSPEQASGRNDDVNSKSDQYSLGATFYELLTGYAPYSGPPAVVIFNVINDPPPAPRSIHSDIPRDLETICQKAMARNSIQRYATCRELADDLKRWLSDRPIRARRVPLREHVTRWIRRNSIVAGLMGLLCLVMLAAAGAILRQQSTPKIIYRDREAISNQGEARNAGLTNQPETTTPVSTSSAQPFEQTAPVVKQEENFDPVISSSKPLAYFAFNGNANNGGTGDATFNLRNTHFKDGALSLNGKYDNNIGGDSDGYRAICIMPRMDYKAFTVAIRFRPDGFKQWQSNTIFVGGTLSRWLELARSPNGNLKIWINNNLGPYLNHEFVGTRLRENDWNEVCLCVDPPNRNVVAYLDGKKAGEVVLPDGFERDVIGIAVKDRKWTFTNYGNGGAFQGRIDALIIYDRALNSNEVATIVSRLKRRETSRVIAPSPVPTGAPSPAVAPFNDSEAREHQEIWAKHLDLPVEYTNSIGMKFRLIPPGEFPMGTTAEDVDAVLQRMEVTDKHSIDCISSEKPQHVVKISQPYYLGMHEVTQGQYETITGFMPSHFSSKGDGGPLVKGQKTENLPVEMVNWHDAVRFVEQLTKREQKESGTTLPIEGYRLPSEAEWEFAAAAGSPTQFLNPEQSNLDAVARYADNSRDMVGSVGEKRANPFGLYDTFGNVWEWCFDSWNIRDYSGSDDKTTIDPIRRIPQNGWRITKGASHLDRALFCRPADRHPIQSNSCDRTIGFRVYLSTEAAQQLVSAQRDQQSVKDVAVMNPIAPLNSEPAKASPLAIAGRPKLKTMFPPSKLRLIRTHAFDKNAPFKKLNEPYEHNGVLAVRSKGGVFGWNFAGIEENQMIRAKLRVRNESTGWVGVCFTQTGDDHGALIWITGDRKVVLAPSMFAREKPKFLEQTFEIPDLVRPLEIWNELTCVVRNKSLLLFLNEVHLQTIDLTKHPIAPATLSFCIRASEAETLVEMDKYSLYRVE